MTKTTKPTIVYFKVAGVYTDVTDFKKMRPKLESDNVYIRNTVDSKDVKEKDGEVILTLNGLKTILKEVAHTTSKANKEYETEQMKSTR